MQRSDAVEWLRSADHELSDYFESVEDDKRRTHWMHAWWEWNIECYGQPLQRNLERHVPRQDVPL